MSDNYKKAMDWAVDHYLHTNQSMAQIGEETRNLFGIRISEYKLAQELHKRNIRERRLSQRMLEFSDSEKEEFLLRYYDPSISISEICEIMDLTSGQFDFLVQELDLPIRKELAASQGDAVATPWGLDSEYLPEQVQEELMFGLARGWVDVLPEDYRFRNPDFENKYVWEVYVQEGKEELFRAYLKEREFYESLKDESIILPECPKEADELGVVSSLYQKRSYIAMLQQLKDHAERVGTPTVRSVNGDINIPSARSYQRAFGGLEKALELLGIQSKKNDLSDARLLEMLQEHFERLNKDSDVTIYPTAETINADHLIPSAVTYYRRKKLSEWLIDLKEE